MLNVVVGAVVILGGVMTYGSSITEVASTLPPRTPQSAITCHSAEWADEHLAAVQNFKVEAKLAPFVKTALADARSAGYGLQISSAYRTCAEQHNLRMSACGIGTYNLYQKPIDLCVPPTEPAGKSMHNEGLAVDFKCSGYGFFESSPCLKWLKISGHTYHLYEHRLEAWHWSTTGY